jgi:sensor histidine kinase YesM
VSRRRKERSCSRGAADLWPELKPFTIWLIVPFLSTVPILFLDHRAISASSVSWLIFMLGTSLASIAGMAVPIKIWKPSSWKTRPNADGGFERPGYVAVAVPAIASLATVCLGFSAGLFLIVRDDSREVSAGSMEVFWIIALMVNILATTIHAALVTRRMFVSGEDSLVSGERVRAAADRARLTALQAQMNPHFLFNTLNTVASLLATDRGRARTTVGNLSQMLQEMLARATTPTVPLRDEVAFVRQYLDVERARFGDRLSVTFDMPTAIDWIPVPAMSLQPLVENAVKYALSDRIEGGSIRVSAEVVGRTLAVCVEDDGPGFSNDAHDGGGLGNLRERVQTLFGERGGLRVDSQSTGARVTMTIPFGSPRSSDSRPVVAVPVL